MLARNIRAKRTNSATRTSVTPSRITPSGPSTWKTTNDSKVGAVSTDQLARVNPASINKATRMTAPSTFMAIPSILVEDSSSIDIRQNGPPAHGSHRPSTTTSIRQADRPSGHNDCSRHFQPHHDHAAPARPVPARNPRSRRALRKAAHRARHLSAVAQRPGGRLQPEDQPPSHHGGQRGRG